MPPEIMLILKANWNKQGFVAAVQIANSTSRDQARLSPSLS
jgi:hypothetical protein